MEPKCYNASSTWTIPGPLYFLSISFGDNLWYMFLYAKGPVALTEKWGSPLILCGQYKI